MAINPIPLIITLMILVSGCAQTDIVSKQSLPDFQKDTCKLDSDCICGGVDFDGSCFIGNKDYYNLYVNKTVTCPDFCSGIAGNLEIRCISGRCVQTFECITDADCTTGTCSGNKCVQANLDAECSSDSDCVIGGCSGTLCQPRNAEQVMTTCEYKEEYSCYRTEAVCSCQASKCSWVKTDNFEECITEARQMT